MARITENTIEKVRLKSDIIQTISDYIDYKGDKDEFVKYLQDKYDLFFLSLADKKSSS